MIEYFPAPPPPSQIDTVAFMAYGGSATYRNNVLVCSSWNINTSNCYNQYNGYFTAPTAGIYFFSFKDLFYYNSSWMQVGFMLNGGQVYRVYQDLGSGNSLVNIGATFALQLSVNDYVYPYFLGGSSSHRSYGSDHRMFSGHLIG